MNPLRLAWFLALIVSVGFMFGSIARAQLERRQRLVAVPDQVATQFELQDVTRRVELLEALKLEARLTRMEILFEQSAKAAEASRMMLIGIMIPIGLAVLGYVVQFVTSVLKKETS